jgi:hypothetical protein
MVLPTNQQFGAKNSTIPPMVYRLAKSVFSLANATSPHPN